MQDISAFDALAVTPQVDVSRDGPSGTGGRDAGMCSTGQTLTHKSRRISRVGSDGKQLAQVGHHPHVPNPFSNMASLLPDCFGDPKIRLNWVCPAAAGCS